MIKLKEIQKPNPLSPPSKEGGGSRYQLLIKSSNDG
jgi:hypothetical protein